VSRPRTTASSIVREITKSYKKTKSLLEESMQGLPKGCKSYLDHVLALQKLGQSYREELATRNIVPLNLGAATKIQYVFSATIDPKSGPVDEERSRFEAEMDEQYSDSSQASATPAVKKSKTKKKGKQ
jgi:hypothetical protein